MILIIGNKRIEMDFNGNAYALLNKLKIHPQTAVVIRNDSIITEDKLIKNSDKIEIISVVSKG